ncbi:MAG: type III-B CRISPR module-associated protein Cmr3, partial [Candidatus Electrothrix sp. AR4]|nr:type III-B CRISPR module-associated protein Cmr3 [Candidatus Electrothrix sp. AR4]
KGDLNIPTIADIPEQAGRIRFKMVFITPALFADGQWLPQHFTKQERETETGRMTVRYGVINGCELDIISACIGKPHKTGGWNLAQWHPKPLRSFVPAGSVFFCEAAADQQQAVQALHNSKTGDETEYGFGHILIGKW